MKKIFSFFLLMATMLLIGGNAWAVTRPANDAASLNDAVADAETGDIVQLTADVNLGATTLQIDKDGVEFTLDLNGHNLTGTKATSTTGVVCMAHGTLTIKNGSIGDAGAQYTVNVSSNTAHDGTVILESGAIYAMNYAVNLGNGSGKFIMNGGEVIVEGNSASVYGLYHAVASCSTIINGGKISATCTYTASTAGSAYGVYAKATGVVVYGGTMVANVPSMIGDKASTGRACSVYNNGLTNYISIHGGYFAAIGGSTEKFPNDLMYAKNLTGGKFSRTPDVSYLDEGYTTSTISETIDGITYTTEVVPTGDKYFAIGGVQYAGLQDAIDAANNGDVIKLIKNTSATVQQKEYIFPAGKSLTLDLNGLTLDRTSMTSGAISGTSTDHSVFNVYGNLTIKNTVGAGVIKCPTPGGIVVAKGGTLTLESGKIEADVTASGGYARPIVLNSGSAFTMSGGELFAQISGSASTVYGLHIAEGATATISGGKIAAKSLVNDKTVIGLMCGGTVTVNDVEMYIYNTGTSTKTLAFTSNNKGAAKINDGKFVVEGGTTNADELFTINTEIIGGQFNRDVQAWIPLGEPYMCHANAGLGTCYGQSLTHEVVDNPAAVAYIRNVMLGKDYTSVSAALAEASDNDELCLLQDMDFAQVSFVVNRAITLDINGHNITSNDVTIRLFGGADEDHMLVLTDKAATKGLISGASTIYLNGGYVTVKDVKVAGTTLCFNEVEKGNYTIQNVVANTSATISTVAKAYYANKVSTTIIRDCSFSVDVANLSKATSTSNYVSVFQIAGSGTLSIYGGTYRVYNTNTGNSKYAGVFNGTAVKISIFDGKFSIEGDATTKTLSKATSASNKTNLKIYGGKFNLDPKTWLVPGYSVDPDLEEGIYKYCVTESKMASVDGVAYQFLTDAIEAAKTSTDHTVTLLHSTILSSTLVVPAGVIFAENGYTMELTANTPLKLENGADMPTCITNANFVAIINESNATRYFYTLNNGISACGATETVKLLQDIENAPRITISSGIKTIDFNGHSLTCSSDEIFYVSSMLSGSTTVNLINGSSTESVLDCTNTDLQSEGLHAQPSIGGSVIVNVGHGVTIKGSYGASVWKNATLNVYGKIVGKRVFAVGGNGQAQYAGTTINIYDGAEVIGAGSGIYHPQEGTLNIYGGTITGLIALGVKAGTVNIYDGTLHATGECNRQSGWSNGIEASGAAIQLESNKSYAAHVNLNITGGNFISDNCYAFYEYVAKNSEHSSTEGVLFNGGKFTGNVQISQDMAYSAGGFITGGNYSHDVVAFCKENYTTIKHRENGVWDGTYDVVLRQDDDKTEIEAANQEVEMPATTETSQVTISGDVTVSTVEQETEVQKIVLGPGADLVVKDGTTLNVGAGGIHIEDVEGSPATVTVEAGGTLTVDGLIYNSNTTNFVIESSEDKIGTLLISPQTEVIGEDHPNGTFYFTSKAKYANGKYTWQRFGVPTADGTVNVTWTNADGTPSTAKTAMYAYDYSIGTMGDWKSIGTGLSGELTFDTPFTPFQCYDMTINENQPGSVYAFTGAFMGNQNASFNMVNGWNYLANSYLAPINLESFLTDVKNVYGDDVSATVYIYRSSDDKWDHVSLADFGDWFGNEPAQTKINPMQSFILKLMNGNNVEGGIDYENNVYNPIVNASASAPKRSARLVAQSVNIEVSNGVESDMVRLVEGQEFSADFDNGYDAPKYMGGLNFAIYAISTDGELADVATDNIEGTELVFNAQTSGVYTLTFSHVNGDYVLRDLANNAQVVMINGATYSFAASAGATAPRFVVEKAPRIVTGVDQVEATQTLGIYSITGQYLGSDWTAIPAGVYVVNGVKMIK